VLLGAFPGMMPAKAIDGLVSTVKSMDMEEVRRELAETETAEPRAVKAGGAP